MLFLYYFTRCGIQRIYETTVLLTWHFYIQLNTLSNLLKRDIFCHFFFAYFADAYIVF